MTALAAREPAWGPVIAAARAGELPLLGFGATPEAVAREAAGLVYLATPYSRIAVDAAGAWCPERSARAMAQATRAAARLAGLGVTAVSPIVLTAGMCHASAALDPLDDPFWARWCAPLLAAARVVVVPDIAGWDRSRGVWREVRAALASNVPVRIYGREDGHAGD